MRKMFIARLVSMLTMILIVSGQLFASSTVKNINKTEEHLEIKQKLYRITSKTDFTVSDIVEVEEIEEDINQLDYFLPYFEVRNSFEFFQIANFKTIIRNKVFNDESLITTNSCPIWISIRRINI